MSPSEKKSFYVFTQYISGMNGHSLASLKNLRNICEKFLSASHVIKVIDLIAMPEKRLPNQLIAVPTLAKELPLPIRKLIGGLSNTNQVLINLEIEKQADERRKKRA